MSIDRRKNTLKEARPQSYGCELKLNMKTSNASNLLEENSGSLLGSSTDTNSISCDSDHDALCAAGDQNQMIQELKKQVSDLECKLKVTEILLACQTDKVNDKDDVIRILQNSHDMVTKTNEERNASVEKLKEQFDTCKEQNKSLELTNSILKIELDQLKSKLIKSQKIEVGLRKKVSKLENSILCFSAKLNECFEKLAEYTLNTDNSPDKEEIVPLNNTKNQKIKVVQRDGMKPFVALFEDIPSAGSGWMVIQRRINGQTKLSTTEGDLGNGFGDMNTSFWLGTDIVHQLTTSQRHELYIEVVDLDGATAYARYDHFEVGSEDEKYKIKSLGSYSGNAGDAFRSLQNAPLEKRVYTDQSFYWWWYNTQCDCNLNGYNADGYCSLFWGRWSLGRKECLLRSCKMLIRPKPK